MLNQKMICTSSGVPRKKKMYSQLAPDTIGFGDSRITASSIPSTTPTTIARPVAYRVTTAPERIRPSLR